MSFLRIRWVVVALVVCAAIAGTVSLRAQTPELSLKAARDKETIDGDLKGAIEAYKRLVDSSRANRAIAAEALLHMAECYQKLGDYEAQSVYERILRDYADQAGAVSVARAHLAPNSEVTVRTVPRTSVLPGNVTPDGRLFAYASWNDGELYIRDLQTDTDRQLTRRGDGNIGLLTMSRDGARIAYQVYSGGCDKGPERGAALCLTETKSDASSAAKTLVSNPEIREIAPFDWSPDGRSIAVKVRRQDRSAQIGLVEAATGSLRVLMTVDWRGPTRIFFSPDGQHLVFDLPANDATEDRTISMVSLDATQRVTLVEHASQNIPMGWSPVDGALLFASDRNGALALWTQAVRGRRAEGAPRLLRANLGGAWSVGVTTRGALFYAVRKYDRDISLVDVDLATGKALTTPMRPIRRYVGSNSGPAWSADGRYMAYTSQRGFDPTNNTDRFIGIRDMSSGTEREVRPTLLYFGSLRWHPDGLRLVTAGTDVKGRDGIFAIDARTGETSLIVDSARGAQPQWSGDGLSLFYLRLLGGQDPYEGATVIERTTVTGTERTVVPASSRPRYFTLAPDGRSLIYRAAPVPGASPDVLWVVRLDTGELREVLRTGPTERITQWIEPQWTPTSDAVVVRMRQPNELWIVPTKDGRPRKLQVDVSDWPFGPIAQMTLHPNGRTVAFLTGELSTDVMVLENFLPKAQNSR